jgi:hypothetical protein
MEAPVNIRKFLSLVAADLVVLPGRVAGIPIIPAPG